MPGIPAIPAIPALTGITPLPSPATGVPSGGGFLGGIGEAAGAFGQGLQQGEQLQEQRRKNATERLALMQQQVASNPAIAKNPSWQNTVKNLYKAAGVPAPLDAQGNVDVNALVPKTKLAEAFAKDPTLIQQAQGMTPETRKAVFGSGAYDTTGIDPSFWTAAPQYTLSPYERLFMRKSINDDLHQMAAGNMDVNQFFAWVNMNHDSLAALNMNPDQILAENPQMLGKISASAQAKIQNLESLGVLNHDKAMKAIADIGAVKSLEDLRRIQGRYYQVKADAIPKELQLRQYQIINSVQQRQQALDQGERRLQQAMTNTDLRSLGVRLQAANQLRVSVDAEQKEYDNLLGIAQRYNAAGSAVPDEVLKQLSTIKPRLDSDRAMIDAARKVQGNVGGIDTPKVTGTHGGGSGGKIVGHVYTDKNGKRAKYLGGDPNSASSWQVLP